MKKRVLITGVTGFVGRQVFDYLSTQNLHLTVVVREGKQSMLKNCAAVDSFIITQDIFAETADWWASVLSDIDTIIHVAWYAEPGKYLQSNKNLDCLQGTLNMTKGAIQAGVRRIVGIGTCFEYDLSHGTLYIDTPIKPLTLYASAKAATFITLSELLPANGIEFVWCRLFYLYGEGEDSRRLVPYLRAKLLAGENAELTRGDQIRDFLDVSEAGRLIAKAALGEVQGVINICSGIPITIKQLACNIADEYGRRDLLRFGSRPDNITDPPCVVGIQGLFSNKKNE